jgi:ribonuclease G
MAKEICISSTPHETRLAILEDDQLAEIYYERENEYTLAGSIYNGRVTRVLPGMQSAFVDLGLERDAFLYVTDFIELEDQEDSDEVEKAAASGAGQAPREVRHPQGDRNGGRQDERGQRSGQRTEPRRDARPPAEEAVQSNGAASAPPPPAAGGQTEAHEESGEAGGRRWRGRRRRRGGRGPGGSPEVPMQSEPVGETSEEPLGGSDFARPEYATETPAGSTYGASAPGAPQATRGQQTPPAFVLPGESLSKYGGTPAAEPEKAASQQSAPARPAPTYKPSTLIEAPLAWDGSGLLPGESISRHRDRQPEVEVEPSAEPTIAGTEESGISADPNLSSEPVAEFVHEETFEDVQESVPPSLHEIEEALHEAAFEFEEEEFESESIEPPSEEEPVALEAAEEPVADEEEFEAKSQTPEESEDASASHRVDPSAPTGFRLFGFGKKKETEAEAESKATATAAPVSTYAPGQGLVEEEVIEGEEFDSTPHSRRHKPEIHDADDYEEETLAGHTRTGELGEMLQEAHLDHRIQLKFDEKNVEEEDFDGEEGEAATDVAPAPGRERHDRGGRGQRGRAPQSGRRGPSRRSAQTSDLPIISDLLKSGQEILVQIAKEPIAKKGARITSHIALPGRFLVFMPTVTHVGVSRKIASDEERHRLKRILVHERGEASGGFIVRTAAEGASEDELRADLRFLMNLWNEIKQRSESSKSPALIYHDLSLIERILRDQVSSNFASIWVDTQEDYERIVRFLNRFSPTLVRRVKLYTKDVPLFEHFGIQDEISKALRSKVWLKSGGSIVINQTEALVAIDINTGKYVGKSARLEDTILKTNLDAVPEIVRQIRLRDLGGIIVIDFIDMDERKNRFKVMAALEEALKSDRAPTKVLQFNDFGLVAITRKRVKQSLERTLSVPCPTCQATGMVKSPTTVCNEIFIELRKMRKHFENADVMLRVNPETVKILKSNGNRWLNEFEELVGKNVLVKSDPTLHPEQFDIQG